MAVAEPIVRPFADPFNLYPDSDGLPVADHSIQLKWILKIYGNLDLVFRDDPNVFVAGNNLIYPCQIEVLGSEPSKKERKLARESALAPDVYVVWGVTKEERGSYKVWVAGGIFPQVIFEVWSPGNTKTEMRRKQKRYEEHGAEEYFEYDPYKNVLRIWVGGGGKLTEVTGVDRFVSPRMGVVFDGTRDPMEMELPGGTRFASVQGWAERSESFEKQAKQSEERRNAAEQRRDAAERKTAAESAARQAAEQARQAEEQMRRTAERQAAAESAARQAAEAELAALKAKLKALGHVDSARQQPSRSSTQRSALDDAGNIGIAGRPAGSNEDQERIFTSSRLRIRVK